MPNNEKTLTTWERLIAAQADMANPTKTREVNAGARRYSYAELYEVLNTITPALAAHGLALVQGVRMLEDGIFVLRTGVADADGELILDTRPMNFAGSSQDAGARETYTRRYALMTAFALAAEDDDDAPALKTPARAAVVPPKPPKAANPTPTPKVDRFARLKALKAHAVALGITAEDQKKALDFITGEADARKWTDEMIAKAEKAVEGMIEDAEAHA